MPLAQTYGTPRGPLDLWQHEQDTICGVEVDLDDCAVEGWIGMDEARVTALIQDYLAKVYGPALEKEIVERVATAVAGSQPNLDGLAAAVEARIAAKLTQ